jgi:hypothetical protein
MEILLLLRQLGHRLPERRKEHDGIVAEAPPTPRLFDRDEAVLREEKDEGTDETAGSLPEALHGGEEEAVSRRGIQLRASLGAVAGGTDAGLAPQGVHA